MGKGNRNSRQRNEAQLANDEKLLAKENAKKNKKKKDRIVSVACLVVALLIVAVLALNVLSETGVFIRAQKAMFVEGDKEMTVNGAMMTYYINSTITTWYNQYYAYVMYGLVSVDLNKDLSQQKLTADDASYMGDASLAGKTWYDFFMETTMENVEMYLTYANAGKDIAECALTDKDREEIKESIKSIKSSLKSNQMSIADQYGKGVTEGDIRACMELMYRASNFAEYLSDKEEEKLKGTEETIVKFREDNKESFYSAEYLKYTIKVSEKTEKTQQKYDAACEAAKKAAEKLATAKTPEEFVQFITLYEKDSNAFIGVEPSSSEETTEETTEKETETTTEKETETTTEETTTTIEDLVDKYTETKYYETEDDFGKWLFEGTAETNDVYIDEETGTEVVTTTAGTTSATTEADTESAAESESTTKSEEVETTKDGKIVYEKYDVTVYLITELPTIDSTFTHNIAYLITDNKEAANKFYANYLSSSKKDRDTFVELAEKYTPEHDHTEEDHEEPVYSYNKVDRAKEKYFNDEYKLINDWIDDAARKNGDNKLIEVKVTTGSGESAETVTYYAVVVFDGQDREAWYADALDGALAEAIEEWYEDAKKVVVPNNDVIDGLSR